MSNILEERMLDIAEASRFLKISRGTLGRYFDEGLERAVVGGKIYTSREAIQRFSVTSEERLRQRREDWHKKRGKRKKKPGG